MEKIYVISCSQDLASIGMDRIRTGVEGLEETTISLDWSKVRFVPVVANETVSFREDETKLVSIRPIKVPANAMVIQSMYGTNGMGHISCIGSTEFKMYNEDRVADMSMFQSRLKAKVMKDDLLGQVLVVPAK
ncbi:MAG: DUF22 domain-containing protein [Candidatus Lokiarchaeota archaeon]|nr:DUF22 domain-containing protein [Candidatus Lokiarchaeota archaeon]